MQDLLGRATAEGHLAHAAQADPRVRHDVVHHLDRSGGRDDREVARASGELRDARDIAVVERRQGAEAEQRASTLATASTMKPPRPSRTPRLPAPPAREAPRRRRHGARTGHDGAS